MKVLMEQLKKQIAAQVAQLYTSIDHNELFSLLEFPPNVDMGDISLPCFKLSKQLRQAPVAIAAHIKDNLQLPGIASIDAVAGYVNFYVDKQLFANQLLVQMEQMGERYGSSQAGAGKTVVIDYSSPNIAKPFHIAHLRSTVIGHALKQIFAFQGYQAIGINHLGDWGTQFGKLIVAYQLWGDKAAVEAGGIDELLRLYVAFHEQVKEQPELEEEARQWFVRMEQGDEQALQLWQWFVAISMQEFERIYQLLHIEFDYITGESFYNDKLHTVVTELQEANLLLEDEGAQLVDLSAFNMSPALILKKDGSSLYHTRDIAAAIYRQKTYHFDQAIYVTDYAQNLHFEQWFKVIELMGYEWAEKLHHVAFGRVSFAGTSLSTRKGNIIKLEEVLQQAISKTKDIMQGRITDEAQLQQVAEQVGVGAVIFHDLSSNRIKDIDFTWETILNFEGETGPYVQYTHARASSVLRKYAAQYGEETIALEQLGEYLTEKTTFQVIKKLALYPAVIEQAASKLEPSLISRYLVELAQLFNHFYHEMKVMVDDQQTRQARMTLVQAVKRTLQRGLALIGIQAPDQM
ncbi:arginine--tRNA ligase [Paenibacillus yanchengensis]|uniref:Arginine--tRNA ligase n=1 Tax=Paenibacillus yanchengensis TaxID=2035833 RepID=A0ABW4YQ98_9BACL